MKTLLLIDAGNLKSKVILTFSCVHVGSKRLEKHGKNKSN